MSLPRYETPFYLDPLPSRRLLAVVLASHLFFVGVVIWAEPGFNFVLFAWGCLGISLWLTWRQHFDAHSAARVRRAVWISNGSWMLTCGDGRRYKARLSSSGFCHPLLIVLNFDLGLVRRRTLLLLPDSLPADTHRRLRTRLRMLKKL